MAQAPIHKCEDPACGYFGQTTFRSCLCHKTAEQMLIEQRDGLLAALKAQEHAEDQQANCPDCDGIGDWAECGRCSELFGTAIELRRAAVAKAEGL